MINLLWKTVLFVLIYMAVFFSYILTIASYECDRGLLTLMLITVSSIFFSVMIARVFLGA